MVQMNNIAVLTQNVINRLDLDTLTNVLNDNRASFRPHSSVKEISREGQAEKLRARLESVDKILFYSPPLLPSELALTTLMKVLKGRLLADYTASFAMAWYLYANDIEYGSIDANLRGQSEPIRDGAGWSKFKHDVVKDALFCNRKNVLLNIPTLWTYLKRPLVISDSLALIPFMDPCSLFLVSVNTYVDKVGNDDELDVDEFTRYFSFILTSYIQSINWMSGLYGYNALPFNCVELVRNNRFVMLDIDSIAATIKAALDVDTYLDLKLDSRHCSERNLGKMVNLMMEGSFS